MALYAPIKHHLDLYGYWLAKRGARTIPARSHIDPADIRHLLPYLMIIERAGDQFRYRLVGTAIARAVGYDATGATVGSYIAAPEVAEEALAIFRRVFTSACPIFATGEYLPRRGACVHLSLLTLPLSDEGRTAIGQTISSLVARFSAELKPERGWLKGLPVRISDVIEFGNAAELEKLCLKWEQCSAPLPLTEEHKLPD
jgi:hypothetical protein